MRSAVLVLSLALAAPVHASDRAADPNGPLDRLDRAAVERFAARTAGQAPNGSRLRLNAVVEAAMNLRTWMAGRPEALLQALSAPERAVLAGLIGDDVGLWRGFFRGSIATLGHAMAERPRAGYYNPLVDGWVVVDFERSPGGGLRPVAVTAFPGAALAPVPADGRGVRPPWLLRRDLAMPSSLALASAANVAAFERAWPPLDEAAGGQALPADGRATVAERLALTDVAVRSFLDDPAYAAIGRQILAYIAKGDGDGLARMTDRPAAEHAMPLQRIGTLSTPARRTFELRGIYRHAGGMMMAFGSPYSGNWLIFADLDVSDSAAPRLNDVVAVDLGQLD